MLPILRATGLTKSFVVHAHGDLALPVLRDVALAVSPGECLALVGPSGAGKSSLLRSLYGNYRPDAGSATTSTAATRGMTRRNWLTKPTVRRRTSRVTRGSALTSSTQSSRWRTRIEPASGR